MVVAVVALALPRSASAAPHAPVRMPDLIGRTRGVVYRIMRHDGLYFVTSGPGAATQRWSDVVSQSPRPGTVVAWHAQVHVGVTVALSRGPRAVPELIGHTRAQVYAQMRRAQLYFQTLGPGSSNGSWNDVVSQSPRPGTRVAWRSEVTLRVSLRRASARARPRAHPKRSTSVQASAIRTSNQVVSGSNYKVGVATWYNYFAGRCATWYLPKGTRIVVHDLTTGRSISCVITDREDHLGDHVVDLSETQFSELAPLWTGVISVKVTW